MSGYAMPADEACRVLAALSGHGVAACVGGGWAVDALVGRQTRPHGDLDLWVDAADPEALFAAVVAERLDRILPWPGDRPWNFVLHDGATRRLDLHFYEDVGDGRLRYGSAADPFTFDRADISALGSIAGSPVRCETAAFALRNRDGYELREIDRHDVDLLRRLPERAV